MCDLCHFIVILDLTHMLTLSSMCFAHVARGIFDYNIVSRRFFRALSVSYILWLPRMRAFSFPVFLHVTFACFEVNIFPKLWHAWIFSLSSFVNVASVLKGCESSEDKTPYTALGFLFVISTDIPSILDVTIIYLVVYRIALICMVFKNLIDTNVE